MLMGRIPPKKNLKKINDATVIHNYFLFENRKKIDLLLHPS